MGWDGIRWKNGTLLAVSGRDNGWRVHVWIGRDVYYSFFLSTCSTYYLL